MFISDIDSSHTAKDADISILEGLFPLSYGQEAMGFSNIMVPDSGLNNITYIWKVEEELDIPALQNALQIINDRHPSLRTTYTLEKNRLVQRIHQHKKVQFEVIDVSGWTATELEKRFEQEKYEPLNLEQTVLRWRVFQKSECECFIVWTTNHIAFDLWSFILMMKELSAFLLPSPQIKSLPLPEEDYLDFVYWQREWIKGNRGQAAYSFWKKEFESNPPRLNLISDHPRPSSLKSSTASHSFRVTPELMSQLEELASKENGSLFNLFLTAFSLLLYRYTGQEEFFIGFPTAGRKKSRFGNILGIFVNTLPLRITCSPKDSFLEFFRLTRHKIRSILKYKDYPFSLLVKQIGLKRDPSHSPAYDVLFSWEDLNSFGDTAQPLVRIDQDSRYIWNIGKGWEGQIHLSQVQPLDLCMRCLVIDGAVEVNFDYSHHLFKKETVQRIAESFKTLLTSIANHPTHLISELPILTHVERKKFEQWNQTALEYNQKKGLKEQFERQAIIQPDAIAIELEENQITYEEVNSKANRLAHFLRAEGVRPNVFVGIFMEPSVESIISILAIMKAGGTYVPLDIEYPKERLSLILKDSQVPIILSKDGIAENKLPLHRAKVVNLEKDWKSFTQYPNSNPTNKGVKKDAVYLLYTSGSTGQPKGVLVSYKGLSNMLNAQRRTWKIKPKSKVLQFSPMGFDASIFMISLALQSGATLVLVKNAKFLLGEPLSDFLNDNKITHALFAPSILSSIPEDEHPLLSHLMVAGEECSVQLASKWSKGRRFFNLYGPTETTVWASISEYKGGQKVPIGYPISNTQLYVLDRSKQRVPLGVPGELYIGGDGISLGYLNREDLTSKYFVSNPFDTAKPKTLYKTGDLVRYLPDGQLEFIGRINNQIKIRGIRVEPGEIEATLSRQQNIQDALVVPFEPVPGKKSLIAYVVSKVNLNIEALRSNLKTKLPQVMVPEHIIVLDHFPLNNSQKVDRKALPLPKAAVSQEPSMLNGKMETDIVNIWKKVLLRDNVKRDDNFFDIGGDSLSLAEVYNALPKNLKRELSLFQLYQYPKIMDLAKFINGYGDSPKLIKFTRNPQDRIMGGHPLSDNAQKVAIIGLAGRFPGANTLKKFWENLEEGAESISHFSEEELINSGVDPNICRDPRYVKSKGMLNEIEFFDAKLFGYSPHEATLMDPQQRLFLECAWEALEHSGYNGNKYPGKIGIFAGSGMNRYYGDYLKPNFKEEFEEFPAMIANDKDFLSSRVAYKLNLKGPAMTIQTACSTSLVAIHTASQAILRGECDMALAGGISLGKLEKSGYMYKRGMILSPDGHCRAFDAKAEGTVPSQGMGIIILKRLEDALEDRDTIHAVILGSAINNDGAGKMGYTTPSLNGQKKVILEALRNANVEASSIGYVEAHGTGTPTGDPIEIEALTHAYHEQTQKNNYCWLGSLKTNLGHLDAAAGIAGLIKAVLALKHEKIPPSLHFNQINPQVNLQQTPFKVCDQLIPWKKGPNPRRVGVSSFGLGGTNAHLILEEPPETLISDIEASPKLLVFSAKSESSLERQAQNLAEYLKQTPKTNLTDVMFTLQMGRGEWEHRSAIICYETEDAISGLEKMKVDDSPPLSSLTPSSVIFLFPKEAVWAPEIVSELYEFFPVFKEQLDLCLTMLKETDNLDLYSHLFQEERPQMGGEVDLQSTQLSIFMIEYALACLWINLGIKPEAVMGEGVGDYAAACLSGVISLKDALSVITKWGQFFSPGLTEQEIKIDRSFIEEYQKELSDIQKNSPKIPWVSSINGRYVQKEDLIDPEFWNHFFSKENYFHEATQEIRLTDQIGLEMGSSVVSTHLFSHPQASGKSGIETIFMNLGELWKMGIEIQWPQLYHGKKPTRVPLPTYPFEREKYWVAQSTEKRSFSSISPPLKPCGNQEQMANLTRTNGGVKKIVLDCWKAYLGYSELNIEFDFFELGGDSLMAIDLIDNLSKTLGTTFSVKSLLENPTIAEFTEHIKQQMPVP